MKKMLRIMSAALTFNAPYIFIPSSAAFKNGDVVNYYLYTDIVTISTTSRSAPTI